MSLVKNSVRYDLVPSAGDSGFYHYPNNDLAVNAGDDFHLQILYKDQTIDAETTVPPAPDSVSISSDKLILSSDTSNSGPPWGFPGEGDSTQTLTVSWKSETGALYYVVVENMESNPDSIETGGRYPFSGSRRLISSPTDQNRYRIQRFNLSYYGRHRVKVYRVNQEYADLYGSRQQDSRDLNEPLTNIQSGLGVFSAFNSNSVYFEVVKE